MGTADKGNKKTEKKGGSNQKLKDEAQYFDGSLFLWQNDTRLSINNNNPYAMKNDWSEDDLLGIEKSHWNRF